MYHEQIPQNTPIETWLPFRAIHIVSQTIVQATRYYGPTFTKIELYALVGCVAFGVLRALFGFSRSDYWHTSPAAMLFSKIGGILWPFLVFNVLFLFYFHAAIAPN